MYSNLRLIELITSSYFISSLGIRQGDNFKSYSDLHIYKWHLMKRVTLSNLEVHVGTPIFWLYTDDIIIISESNCPLQGSGKGLDKSCNH